MSDVHYQDSNTRNNRSEYTGKLFSRILFSASQRWISNLFKKDRTSKTNYEAIKYHLLRVEH